MPPGRDRCRRPLNHPCRRSRSAARTIRVRPVPPPACATHSELGCSRGRWVGRRSTPARARRSGGQWNHPSKGLSSGPNQIGVASIEPPGTCMEDHATPDYREWKRVTRYVGHDHVATTTAMARSPSWLRLTAKLVDAPGLASRAALPERCISHHPDRWRRTSIDVHGGWPASTRNALIVASLAANRAARWGTGSSRN